MEILADSVATGSTMELRVHQHAIALWNLQAVALIAAVMMVGFILVVVLTRQWWSFLILLPAILIIGFVRRYNRLYASRFRCQLLNDGLLLHRGVWWRSEIFVPRARVQHTDVEQGPVARRLGIATIKIFTAGASTGEIGIRGLAHGDALLLRDELLGRHGQDGV